MDNSRVPILFWSEKIYKLLKLLRRWNLQYIFQKDNKLTDKIIKTKWDRKINLRLTKDPKNLF